MEPITDEKLASLREDLVRPHQPFSDTYWEGVFALWFAGGQPSAKKLWAVIEPDEYGRKPSEISIRKKVEGDGWLLRADALKQEAIQRLDNELITQRKEMMSRQSSMAKELQDAGMDYLRENGFDSAASAVQAIIRGATLERETRGVDVAISRVASMSNEQLSNAITKMLNKNLGLSSDTVDGETEDITPVEPEEEVDASSTDEDTDG